MNKKESYLPPDQVFKELFADLHLSGHWSDGKTIADMIPLYPPAEILANYASLKKLPAFDLKAFAEQYFEIPDSKTSGFVSDPGRPVEEHINILWEWLQRSADQEIPGSSLVPLPFPYIVPGGRFNEIYYWDSFFTMLGLQASGKTLVIENMVKNFAYLIDTFGFIPNGNRSYFLGRSQPPFFSLMVDLLANEKGEEVFTTFLPQLLKEHAFWMAGREVGETNRRLVFMPNGGILNRYYDDFPDPRAEMYGDDLETHQSSGRSAGALYLDIRAACESGWDFSARWLKHADDLGSIYTTDIVPVDLNCLLVHLEQVIARALTLAPFVEGAPKAADFEEMAQKRIQLIQAYCWSEKHQYFMDYDVANTQSTEVVSLAGIFPLYFNIAQAHQAEHCAQLVEQKLLRPGGVVSTAIHSGQQWDAPNGWAPLQWMTISGLRNYGHQTLADEIKKRWTSLNIKVFKDTGKLLEKYNVEDLDLLSGGGEYPVQDGFGWTNGVLLKLLTENI